MNKVTPELLQSLLQDDVMQAFLTEQFQIPFLRKEPKAQMFVFRFNIENKKFLYKRLNGLNKKKALLWTVDYAYR